jgi:hypothetical protein
MDITFDAPDSWWSKSDEVRFYARLSSGAAVLCRITHECVEERLGGTQEDNTAEVARAHADRIKAALSRKLRGGGLEYDGSVLLTSDDDV